MTIPIIITLCSLLLLAYVFELSSSKTRIPSVILLLSLGWGLKQLVYFLINEGLFFSLPKEKELEWTKNLPNLLSILGTVGLIVIVLEGALDVHLNKKKFALFRKSIIVAVIPMLLLGFGLAWAFTYFGNFDFKSSLTSAIPLCVISSAIAIPSVKYLSRRNKEFVIYESSMSDILGVLFFNFVALNVTINFSAFMFFIYELGIIAVISFVATVGLAFLLSRIDHHIKFLPIIILVILIYAISKVYHLPALIFILLFGLFIGNLEEFKKYKFINALRPDQLNLEVKKFKEILSEATFLIRALFFLLFGFLITTDELLNPDTLVWALGISGAIFLIRFIQLKLAKLPASPLLFIAPRGLITILLFLEISAIGGKPIEVVNRPLLIQIIVITSIILMLGLMFHKKISKEELELTEEN